MFVNLSTQWGLDIWHHCFASVQMNSWRNPSCGYFDHLHLWSEQGVSLRPLWNQFKQGRWDVPLNLFNVSSNQLQSHTLSHTHACVQICAHACVVKEAWFVFPSGLMGFRIKGLCENSPTPFVNKMKLLSWLEMDSSQTDLNQTLWTSTFSTFLSNFP